MTLTLNLILTLLPTGDTFPLRTDRMSSQSRQICSGFDLGTKAGRRAPKRQEATARSANRRLPVSFKALIRRLMIGGHARQTMIPLASDLLPFPVQMRREDLLKLASLPDRLSSSGRNVIVGTV